MKKLILALLLSTPALAQNTLLHCGTLIDGIANEPRRQVTVIVNKNRIVAVENGYRTPAAGKQVIDLKSKTVLPGLIDCHVHLEQETRRGGSIDQYQLNPADVAFQAAGYTKTTLLAGFTTVRDLGGSGVNIALCNAINRGTEGARSGAEDSGDVCQSAPGGRQNRVWYRFGRVDSRRQRQGI